MSLNVPENADTLDVARIKKDFPILQSSETRPLVYLDSAASSQRPSVVLDAMNNYYETTHANVHRGVYHIAEVATQMYEDARLSLGRFIGAPKPHREIVFTKNATEGLNLLAYSLGRHLLGEGDVVLLTQMEHHANLVPWMIMKDLLGFEIRYIGFDDSGRLILDDLDEQLKGVKIVGVTLMSNVLGTITPIREIVQAAHSAGAYVIADGAQYVPHISTDVKELGVDALALTGHKMLGPTGIGAIWAKEELLEMMPPFLGGGDMISDVRLDGFVPNELPYKFEAGTPPIAEAIGLAAAIDYLQVLGMPAIREHEIALTDYAMKALADRFGEGITIYGPNEANSRGGVLSFRFKDIHPHDISQLLDQANVCVRAGHHCAKTVMQRLGVAATARASLYLYNDEGDVDALVAALAATESFFS